MVSARPRKNRYSINARLDRNPGARALLARLADRIHATRIAKGWSRNRMAREVGVSWQCIYHIESAECFPSFPVYAAICEKLGQQKPPLT